MSALNNLKIGIKMIAGFTIIAILLIGVALLGYFNMQTIDNDLNTLYTDRLLPIAHLGQADAEIYDLRGDLLKFVLVPEEQDQIEVDINSKITKVEKYMEEFRATYLVQEEIDELAKFDAAWAAYKKEFADVVSKSKTSSIEQIIPMLEEGSPLSESRNATSESLDALIIINEKVAKELHDDANLSFANATLAMSVLSLFALLLAVVIGYVLTRSIATPLANIAVIAEQIGAGDLTVNLPDSKRKDEIGVLAQAFQQMVKVLRGSTSDLSMAVNQIGSSASEILAATTQVASGTAETASAINETTTTVEEVRQAAQLSSQKAQFVSDNAQRVAQASLSGQKAVDETIAGMDRVRLQMESIAQMVMRLSEQSQSIGGIIASVTDLADQSNLLAVNAAIEAARAGEQGKGFAVVAQEIKSLAEQSKLATTQVRSILSDVQKATNNAVLATEQGSNAVEIGVKQAAQAGEAINILTETSGDAVQAATQILVSSQQQVVGMDQIGIAMENINEAGSQNVSSMKQMEIAAQDLHLLGQKLKELIAQFKV